MVSLKEAKEYLKVEYEEEDTLLLTLIRSAEDICRDILRQELTEDDTVRIAVLYAVGFLFENRGCTDFTELVQMLKCILSGKRREVF